MKRRHGLACEGIEVVSELSTGTTIDRYVVQEPLGRGGFSTVYRASHFMIGHSVALKILLPEHTSSPVIRERLFREAKAAASIGNPHIVKVLDCGTSPEGHMFVAMEYLEGKVLKEVITSEAPLPIERSLEITLQVLDGLAAAHGAGIIHRDIKPENIFLLEDPEFGDFVKLLDFGISKVLADNACALTNDGEVLGTPMYMAPEQIKGAARVDHRADIYAVSAVLYHMLSRRRPHMAQTLAELARQLLMDSPAPLDSVAPHVPEALSHIVMRGLARDPEARWLDALSYSSALRDFLPSVPNEPRHPESWSKPSPVEPIPEAIVAPQSPALPRSPPTPPESPDTWPHTGWAEEAPALYESGSQSGPQQAITGQAEARATQSKIPLWLVGVLVAATALVTGGVAIVIAIAVGLFSDSPEDPIQPQQQTVGVQETPNNNRGPTKTPPPANVLRPGQPVMGTLNMGQQLDYPMSIVSRGMTTITASSSDFDTYLYLLVNGGEMAHDDDGGGGLNSRLSLFLEPGDYVVRVASYQNSGAGTFVLTVY